MATPARRPNAQLVSEPARAKVTTISTRSSPSIPTAAQAYEPFVKSVLSERLIKQIFLYSAGFTFVATGVWRTWCEGVGAWGFFSGLAPSTILYASFLWVSGVLPVLLMRKAYLRVPSSHGSSPMNVVKKAVPNLRGGIYVYATCAVCFTLFHVLSSNTPGGLRLFVKSKKHPYYLNGRFLFVFTSQTVHAIMFFLRNVMLNRFYVPRKIAAHPNSSQLAKSLTLSITVFLFSLLCSCINLAIFAFGRSIYLPILFKTPVLSMVLQPFAAHFLKGSLGPVLLAKQLPLVITTFFLGLLTVTSWEFSETMFDLSVAEPISITPRTVEPFIALISGITSSDTYFRHFAYSELKQLAADKSPNAIARRTAFFSDQKYNPTLWSHLSREALVLLTDDYGTFLRRGHRAPPETVPTAAPQPSKGPEMPSTPLLRKQIFKAPKESPVRSVIDSLASDGQIAQAADSSTSHIPELFRSTAGAVVSSSNVVAEVKKVEENTVNWVGTLQPRFTAFCRNSTPSSVTQALDGLCLWWSRDRIDKAVKGSLENKETDTLVVDVLSHLTCASLSEDKYGVVQRDIPKILETFLLFLTAIEEYRSEISALDTLTSSSDEEVEKMSPKELREKERIRTEVIKGVEALDFMEDSLKEGVIRIVVTFGDSLSAFKFPPRIAMKLQGYVEYS